jgi:hypothetical protein
VTPQLVRELRADLGRGFVLRHFRSAADNACGLISRCGHYGLPIQNITTLKAKQPSASQPCGALGQKLSLTERFGQDTLLAH